ncbi:hypothetical protein ABIB57_003971 [Devosia sp. UYZn731]|uniref:hypothetical protein n=1 Tax=Devosia sp. UYZn731 TaxID=3156345 RepID=UPI0033974656
MSDNVVKFRRIEKKPEKPPNKVPPKMPGWLPWVVLVAVAVGIVAWQQLGMMGGPPA